MFGIDYLNIDTLSAILFLLILLVLIIKKREKLTFQTLVKIGKVPIVYAVLWKTTFGISFMDKFAMKYRELAKLIGYCFIGFAFFGIIFISLNLLVMLFNLFTSPLQTSQGVALLLPLTHIPGLGYLSFWHFLITIFLVAVVHEFAHGILSRVHNIPVRTSGLGVFALGIPLFPLAFVEPDEKKLVKQTDIVQYSIFSAGPMINIVVAVIFILLSTFALAPIEKRITDPVGFSYTGLLKNYSAEEVGMAPGMIITKANNVTVLDYQSFKKTVGTLRPNDIVTLETDNQTFIVTAKPSPDDPTVGYIGINQPTNERRFKKEYQTIGPGFAWTKELIRWIVLINFLVGIMNLLPLIFTDGGRMLKVALEKIWGDAKQADKLWVAIGLLFIFTLLAALLIKYGFSIGSLF